MNRGFGIVVTLFTAIVGTSIFTTLNKTTNDGWDYIKVTLAIISVITTILSVLQNALNFSDRAAQYKKGATMFETLNAEFEKFFLRYDIPFGLRTQLKFDEVQAAASDLISKFEKTSIDTVTISDKTYNIYRKFTVGMKLSDSKP